MSHGALDYIVFLVALSSHLFSPMVSPLEGFEEFFLVEISPFSLRSFLQLGHSVEDRKA